MAHTEDASKLVEKDVVIDDTATPSVELAKDDCYYAFIRLYARDVRR